MPYRSKQTGEHGLSHAEVAQRLPNVSLPPDGSDLSDLGFPFYAPTSPPAVGWHERAVDITTAADVAQKWDREVAVSLEQAKTRRVAMIKAEALERIRALFGCTMQELVWREINTTARAAELANRKHSAPLTPEEQAEADAIQAKWDTIKVVRVASNSAEARVSACATVADVVAVTW